jgi:hypothetical protein
VWRATAAGDSDEVSPLLPAVPSRAQLREQLVAARIAGDVATPRESNVRNATLMCERAPDYHFGLELDRAWSRDEVLAVMAERVGTNADPGYAAGADTIDPDRTIDRLDVMRERLTRAARDRERVLLATGHPTGLLGVHAHVAQALQGAGCEVVLGGDGVRTAVQDRAVEVRHVLGVAVIRSGGELLHTHAPDPMRAVLSRLDGERPDLVVADHGWAGAAAQAGIDTMGFADSNDPALFVGEAEGKVAVVVPLDDNVLPSLYAPLTAYLLRGIGG